MLKLRRHVLSIKASSAERHPMGMPRNMLKEPTEDKKEPAEADLTEGHSQEAL